MLRVPIMALSATAPPSVISVVSSNLCMSEFAVISGPLDRSNLFYSIDSVKSVSSVFYLLTSLLSSASSLEAVPRTLIFCLSKDALYEVYSYLVRSCNSLTAQAVSGVATGEHWGNIGGTLGEHWGNIGGTMFPQKLWACSFIIVTT